MDHNGEGELYYQQYYIIPTTKSVDKVVSKEMTNQLKNVPYSLFKSNCTQAVQEALIKGGISIGDPTWLPNKSMESIKKQILKNNNYFEIQII